MSYFLSDSLSKNLLIRAAAMGVMLAVIHQLQLLTENKSFDSAAGSWSSISFMIAPTEVTKPELPY